MGRELAGMWLIALHSWGNIDSNCRTILTDENGSCDSTQPDFHHIANVDKSFLLTVFRASSMNRTYLYHRSGSFNKIFPNIDGQHRNSSSTLQLPSFKHVSCSSGKRMHRTSFLAICTQGWFSSIMMTNAYLFQKEWNLYFSVTFQMCSLRTLTYLLHSCAYIVEILPSRDILQTWIVLELHWIWKT